MNGQATDWEKIVVNHIFDKGIESRIYKEFSKANNKPPNKNWAQFLNRHFFWLGDTCKNANLNSHQANAN